MKRCLRIGAFVALVCSVRVRAAEVKVADLSSHDAARAAETLLALRTQRESIIRDIVELLAKSYAAGDKATAVNCLQALGELRASEAACQVAEYTTLIAHEYTQEGYVKDGKLRDPRRFWPAIGALSQMGLDGVRAIHKVLVDPARDPETILRSATLVTRYVLGDFAAEYAAHVAKRAKGDVARQRLAALEERLRK